MNPSHNPSASSRLTESNPIEKLTFPCRSLRDLEAASPEVALKAMEIFKYVMDLLPFTPEEKITLWANFPEIKKSPSSDSFFLRASSKGPELIAINHNAISVDRSLFHEIGHYIRESLMPWDIDLASNAELESSMTRYSGWKRWIGPLAAPWKDAVDQELARAHNSIRQAHEFFAAMFEEIFHDREVTAALMKHFEPDNVEPLRLPSTLGGAERMYENFAEIRRLELNLSDIVTDERTHPDVSLERLRQDAEKLGASITESDKPGGSFKLLQAFVREQKIDHEAHSLKCPAWARKYLVAHKAFIATARRLEDDKPSIVCGAKALHGILSATIAAETERRYQLNKNLAEKINLKETYADAYIAAKGELGESLHMSLDYKALVELMRQRSKPVHDRMRDSNARDIIYQLRKKLSELDAEEGYRFHKRFSRGTGGI